MAKTLVVHFDVKGVGTFPTDMLRYDQCWPSDTDSATKINPRHQLQFVPYTVHLTSHSHPTNGRWASFGFTVSNLRSERV